MTTTLGKLERISLREAWRHEATEFTPWLAQAENLNQLADSLGLSELELVQTEYPVGDFYLDILCSDDDGEVMIENQLDKTNHTHLGQILTYAAGVGAKKVIWVAESFRPEHVAALEFLNQNTTSDLNFFAVEMELWRIENSPMAPSFNIVVKPNDWAKIGRESARVAAATTPVKQLQLKFWTAFVAHLDASRNGIRPQKAGAKHWLSMAMGRSGFHISATINSREDRLGIEVYIDSQKSKEHYQHLLNKRQTIEQQLGFSLDWQELPDSHACRIAMYRPDSKLEDEAKWSEYFGWLSDIASKLMTVFKPLIRDLP